MEVIMTGSRPTDDFERMWRDLAPVGRSSVSGGDRRSPFAGAEREAVSWFLEQCSARSLEVERDAYGNLAAWWVSTGSAGRGTGSTGGSAVLTGSHLDSVHDGGAYDGPLGVVSALAAVDVLRDRGVAPKVPVGVGVFVEEEGSRFGLACLGSRLATGTTSWSDARSLTDRDGVSLEDALADVERGEADLLDGVGRFVELHVEQGRDLVHREVPLGLSSGIWPHGRYRFEFSGQANHAGTTRMEDRRDPMLTYAMTALSANKQARLSGQRATFGRLSVHPNGTNAVPSAVTAWLDARADTSEHLDGLVGEIERLAQDRAGRDGTALSVVRESVSPQVRFDADLTRELAALGADEDLPVIATMAGHDAGVLSAAGVRTAMLFVRNPTGVSHAPDEHAGTADCLAGVEALADTLQRLCT
jgi:N-carbamoyl-L-amino-acid hydrolase